MNNVIERRSIRVVGIVRATPLVPRDELDVEDREVLGTYEIDVTVPIKDYTSSEDAILDEFHATIPINVLDDFDIVVNVEVSAYV